MFGNFFKTISILDKYSVKICLTRQLTLIKLKGWIDYEFWIDQLN